MDGRIAAVRISDQRGLEEGRKTSNGWVDGS
jgi:hypothetical protein